MPTPDYMPQTANDFDEAAEKLGLLRQQPKPEQIDKLVQRMLEQQKQTFEEVAEAQRRRFAEASR